MPVASAPPPIAWEHLEPPAAPWLFLTPLADAQQDRPHHFDVVVVGREIRFTGDLPSYLAGDILAPADPRLAARICERDSEAPDAPSSATVIGHYEETLTPLLVNGQFVGTTGNNAFRFWRSPSQHDVILTITSHERSLIQAVNPQTGALEVATSGTITGSDGLFPDLQGQFTSLGHVALAPNFFHRTRVHFALHRRPPSAAPLPSS